MSRVFRTRLALTSFLPCLASCAQRVSKPAAKHRRAKFNAHNHRACVRILYNYCAFRCAYVKGPVSRLNFRVLLDVEHAREQKNIQTEHLLKHVTSAYTEIIIETSGCSSYLATSSYLQLKFVVALNGQTLQ